MEINLMECRYKNMKRTKMFRGYIFLKHPLNICFFHISYLLTHTHSYPECLKIDATH